MSFNCFCFIRWILLPSGTLPISLLWFSSESSWEELQGVEKIILLAAAELLEDQDSKAKLLDQLKNLIPIPGKQSSIFQLFDALALVVFAYSLVGPGFEDTDEETLLHDAILKALLAFPGEFMKEKEQSTENLERGAQKFFEGLRSIMNARNVLDRYR
jgi:hypothetical protein